MPIDAKLPFGMGKIDFGDPRSLVMGVLALVLGFMVFDFAGDLGAMLSAWVQRTLNVGPSGDQSGVPDFL